ncbi:unnamed protein product [Mesocestoides corti]|nr:unnamed protein product [Mesocestoides corti]
MQSILLAFSASTSAFANEDIRNFPCRFHRLDITHCASQYQISRIPDETQSYGFGFGSVDDAETMCKSKWHLRVQVCIGDRVIQRCLEHGASEFQLSMWRFIFDSRPHERAANYLCKPHNMKIFRTHREQCFKPHEAGASVCSQRQSRELARATALLASRTEDVPRASEGGGGDGAHDDDDNDADAGRDSLANDYVAYIQQQISAAHCETTLEKIRCLTAILQRNCSQNAVKLIQNYFRELLPKHCRYTNNFQAGAHIIESRTWEKHKPMETLRQSSQTHILNDANHMETSLTSAKGSNDSTTLAHLFHTLLILFILVVAE